MPLSPLNWIARYRDTTVSFVYPPVHQLVLLVAYTIVLLGWKAAGMVGATSTVYPYGIGDPTLVFSSLLLVTNLVSLGMGVGVLAAMRQFRLGRSEGVWYAMSLLGLSGVFVYYARVGNLDVPYLFWVVLSWLLVWRYLFLQPSRRLLILAGIAGALAIGTKDQAIGVEFGLGLTILLVAAAGPRQGLRERFRSACWFGCAILAAYGVSSVAVNPWRWWAHISFVTSDHVLPEYPASLWGQCEVFGRSLVRLSHILTPSGLLLAGLGFAMMLRVRMWRESAVLFLPPLAYYASIIMRVRATEERYLLPMAFALALSAGFAASELLAWARHSRTARRLAWCLVAAVLADQAVEGFIPVTYCQVFDVRRDLSKELPSLVPPGSPLLIIEMNSFNVPDSHTYGQYRLMLPPGKKIDPPSSHGAHVLAPYDPQYRYVLAGSTLREERWPPVGRLIRRWVYPEWITSRVAVPAIYEFALYERKQ
jgi:hypothetical protein